MLVGIDLGTMETKLSFLDISLGTPKVMTLDGGKASLRSVVYIEEDGNVLVGSEAENAGIIEPSRAILVPWKRYMGTDEILQTIDGKDYRAKDVAVLILKKVMKVFEEKTGQVISMVSLTVPHNYNENQRLATQEAAEELNLKVVGLFAEPTAAACHDVNALRDGIILVFDVGGGTTDTCILEVTGNLYNVLATNGVPALGGVDYHKRLFDRLLAEFKNQHGIEVTQESHPHAFMDAFCKVEAAKISLAQRPAVKIPIVIDGKALNFSITQEEFQDLVRDLTDQAMECAAKTLKDKGISAGDLKAIMPVGGGSLVSGFNDAIEKKFGRKPHVHPEPHFAVCLGATVLGRISEEIKGRTFKTPSGRILPAINRVLHDISEYPYGVAIEDENTHQLVNSVILKKGMPIPYHTVELFQLARCDQDSLLLRVLQGEQDAPIASCIDLGSKGMDGLRRDTGGAPHKIEVEFDINSNGILAVKARDPFTGKMVEVVANTKAPKNGGKP